LEIDEVRDELARVGLHQDRLAVEPSARVGRILHAGRALCGTGPGSMATIIGVCEKPSSDLHRSDRSSRRLC
jgi:hypothetical protein